MMEKIKVPGRSFCLLKKSPEVSLEQSGFLDGRKMARLGTNDSFRFFGKHGCQAFLRIFGKPAADPAPENQHGRLHFFRQRQGKIIACAGSLKGAKAEEAISLERHPAGRALIGGDHDITYESG